MPFSNRLTKHLKNPQSLEEEPTQPQGSEAPVGTPSQEPVATQNINVAPVQDDQSQNPQVQPAVLNTAEQEPIEPQSTMDLVKLRALMGIAETPESKIATVREFTGDKNARFIGDFPKAPGKDISFVDPATGKEVLINDSTGTMGDIAEGVGASGRPVSKVTGSVLLGGLGLVQDATGGSEGLATTAGVAAGEELFGQAFDMFAKYLGVQDPKTTLENVGKAGEEIALDTLLPAVLEPFFKSTNKVRKNFISTLNDKARKRAVDKFEPKEEFYDALIESGLEDPTGAWGVITGNENIKRDLHALSTTANGKKFRDKAVGFLNFSENLADQLPELADSSVIDKTVAGRKIKEFATQYEKDTSLAINVARKTIKSKSEGDVPISNTLPFIIGRYQEWSELPASGKLIDDNDVMNAIMKDISGKVKKDVVNKEALQGTIEDIIESGSENIDPVISEAMSKGFDLDKLLALRTAALRRERKILDKSDPRKISYQELAGAINKDIESALGSEPKALSLFKRSNKQYALRKKVFNEQLSKFVRNGKGVEVSDDRAFKEFISRAKTGPTEINQVYKKMPLSVKKDVASTLLERMVRNPQNQSLLSNNFDPVHFLKEYKSLPDTSKEVLFKHQEGLKESLDSFASIMKAFQENQRFRNSSGTALYNVKLSDLRNPKEAIFNYLLTVPGVRRISPSYMTSELMTNKDFMQWVVKGGEKPNKAVKIGVDSLFQGLPEVIRRNPQIRSDVSQFVKGMLNFYDEQEGRENIRKSQPVTPSGSDRKIFNLPRNPINTSNGRPQPEAQMLGVRG